MRVVSGAAADMDANSFTGLTITHALSSAASASGAEGPRKEGRAVEGFGVEAVEGQWEFDKCGLRARGGSAVRYLCLLRWCMRCVVLMCTFRCGVHVAEVALCLVMRSLVAMLT